MNFNNNSSNFSVPDNTLYNAIYSSKATIQQTIDYYRALQAFVRQENVFQHPECSTALDHLEMVGNILELANVSLEDARAVEFEQPGDTEAQRDRLQRSFTRQKTFDQLAAEILAAATGKNPQLALTKVAAINNLPYQMVESLAQNLIKEQGLDDRYDLQKSDYERCIQQIREVELTEDPGLRDYKLHQMARQYRFRNKKDMMEVYYKSLLVQHLDDPISLDEYREQNPGSVRWLMRGWIPEGALILLHGHGGLGKTLFTHHLFKHLVRGVDWNEYKVETGKHGILYIQTDTPLAIASQALKQAGLTELGLPISVHGSWRVEFMSYLYSWIKKQRPALVIIDSLTSINRTNTISENDTEYARPVLQLKDIAAEFNTSFVIIHHSNGAGEVRGSKAIRNAVDAVWRLEAASKKESDLERILVMEKFRGRACGRYRLKFDDEEFDWSLLEPEPEDGEVEQNSGVRRLIVNHLSKHRGVKYCAEDLAEAIRMPEATVRRELPALARESAIDRVINPDYCCGRGNHGEPKFYYLIDL